MTSALMRLRHDKIGVRRLAALEIAHAGDVEGVLEHLEQGESDEKTAITLIRALADAGASHAAPFLKRLYDDPETPVRTAHAAILAHDRIEAEPCRGT